MTIVGGGLVDHDEKMSNRQIPSHRSSSACSWRSASRSPAFAETKTQIRLLLSAETARPGDIIWAGLEMNMPPTWHTYWRNGGDAGQATEIKWILPAGITAGEINWPVPVKETDTAGDSSLVTYIYTNQVVLLIPLTLDKSLRDGPLTFKASAKWMECSDICNFGDSDATATLTIGDAAKPSPDAATIENWRAKVPQPDTNSNSAAYWASDPPKDNARGLLIDWKTNVASGRFLSLCQYKLRRAGDDGCLAWPGGNDSPPQNCQEERRRLAKRD